MQIARVFADISLKTDSLVELPIKAARHLTQVLRLERGSQITVFNGNGFDYYGELVEIKPKVIVRFSDISPSEPIPALLLHLAIGISKGERMDFALQKAVELGVSEITPLFTERSVVKLNGNRLEKRLEHWQGIVISACEQSGRKRIPKLNTATTLLGFLASPPTEMGLLLDHRADKSLHAFAAPHDHLTLLIGPEGGLSPTERATAGQLGYQNTRLGPRVLRTETAPLAALAAIQTLWGDFKQTSI